MSNYSKGNWQEIWDGLFWRFMDTHRDFFLKNPRLSMLVYSFDKMDQAKKAQHLTNANQYLSQLSF
jgi:deoxyribodipyrimidine photolyase-related protein